MPILVVTAEQAAILRQMIAAWPRLQPVLQTLVADAAPTRNESPAMKRPATIGADSDGSAWFEIQSSSSIGTNQWNYKGREMKSGDTSSLTGLVETVDTTEFDLRNSFESIALGGMSGISSLVAIANGSIVRAWPEYRNDSRVFVFDRANDIVC